MGEEIFPRGSLVIHQVKGSFLERKSFFHYLVFMPGALFWSLLIWMSPAPAKEFAVCDHIVAHDGRIKLNRNEKILVCGQDRGSEGWQQIPLPQAQFHLTAIMQNLGYLEPRFEREGDRLNVWMGSQTKIKSLKVNGAERDLDPDKKRKIVGETLVPDKLNEVNRWADFILRSHGFACPQINVQAMAWEGEIDADIQTGPRQRIRTVQYGELEGLDLDALLRYQPFSINDRYDIRKTEIMSARMLNDGLFQSATFEVQCEGEDAHLKLRTMIGKPRLVRFGVGASTEELPFVDIGFKNARLDDRASSFTATAHASPIWQYATASSELYWFRGWPRMFLGPRFRVDRKVEVAYQEDSAKLGGDIGRNWDDFDTRWTARAGPTLNYSKTRDGPGPADVKYLTIEGSLTAMDHRYEYGLRSQEEGWNGSFYYRGQRKGLGSEINVDRYEWNGKFLWNIAEYSPPLFVLATRVQAIAVDTERLENDNVRENLPLDYRIYYGGDDNLRGFGRKTLRNGQLGYLTAGYVGWELRLIEVVPFRVQPFLLLDLARLGNRRMTLDESTYLSQGLGVRWSSPFGTLRASAAQGRIEQADLTRESEPDKWVYFVSFGQEF